MLPERLKLLLRLSDRFLPKNGAVLRLLGVFSSLLLAFPSAAPATGKAASLKRQCTEALVAAVPQFYSGSEPTATPYPEAFKEATRLLRDEYVWLLKETFLKRIPRREFATWIIGENHGYTPDIPKSMAERFLQLPLELRQSISTDLKSGSNEKVRQLAVTLVKDTLYREILGNIDNARVEWFFREYMDFFGMVHDIEDVVRPDGTFNVSKLLKRRLVNRYGGASAPVFIDHTFDRDEDLALLFVVLPDGHMRVAVSYRNFASEIQRTVHSFLAYGQPVELAGEFYLNHKNYVYAMTLASGHYMTERTKAINGAIYAHLGEGTTPDQARPLRFEAANADRARMGDILDGLGIRYEPPSDLNPKVFYSRWEEIRDFLKKWGSAIP